ncbi:MAG TPA: hypothetical protein VMH88_11130 [Gemmatimonadales bacterium]|nr:hypothetical protein [Gemmatimonadales bacterium]
MFRQILFTQWKWARLPVLAFVLAGFALPLLSAQAFSESYSRFWFAPLFLGQLQSLGAFYPLLAALIGLIMALTAWAADHRGRHVYALSLPIPRWHYTLLRFGAGAVLILLPTLALWLSALIATSLTKLPMGLHAYPTTLAVRFALATLIAFGALFAVSAGTSRAAGIVLGLLAAVVLAQLLFDLFEIKIQIIDAVLYRIYIWPGPLEIFTGHWMLFDV